MWVRGLKQSHLSFEYPHILVAPYVGAWIETERQHKSLPSGQVAPYVGAWIETCAVRLAPSGNQRRTLCGCVD